jgi:hypothetical protein
MKTHGNGAWVVVQLLNGELKKVVTTHAGLICSTPLDQAGDDEHPIRKIHHTQFPIVKTMLADSKLETQLMSLRKFCRLAEEAK